MSEKSKSQHLNDVACFKHSYLIGFVYFQTFLDTVQMNPSDISRLFWSFVTLLTAACQSPDECQRYDLPLLYWDCLTPPSRLIHPQENPNALIPRGNHFFFFTIYLAMIYWLWLPPSQRITDPFWEIRFSHLSWVCMWHRSPETVWEKTDFEEQRCVNLCGVTGLLSVLWPMDGPVILCRSPHLSTSFISW